jgi:hypothetical protein
MKLPYLAALAWLGFASPAMAAQGTGCMPTTGTVSGLTMAQDINAGIAALISSNSGSAAPVTDCSALPIKGQLWLDTGSTPNALRQYDGVSTWVAIGYLDGANHVWSPPVGGGTGSISAASTTDLCASPAAVMTINGTTPISSFGTSCAVGIRKTLIFNGATPLTYNAVTLVLPGQKSYTASAGDIADAIYLGSGNWRIRDISKIDGTSVIDAAAPLGTVLYGDYAAVPAKMVYGAGQAISRTTYPEYLAAVTRAQAGTLSTGSNTISSVANTSGLGAGMPIEGTGIPASTTISSVTTSTIVMSANATASGAQTVTAFLTGYGSGGSSSTVGVKDCRGRVMAGRDDMNGTAANRLTSSYFGSGSVINSGGGTESLTLTLAQLPTGITSVNASQAISVAAGSTVHIPTTTGNWINQTVVGGSAGNFPQTLNPVTDTASLASTGNNSISVTSNNTSGSAHRTVQPTAIAECVVVVLP